MTTANFEVQGFQARVEGSRVDLIRGADHVATVTFRPSGVFTIVERGRGTADRLPAEYGTDLQAATDYVIGRFWPAGAPLRRAA